ncbi:MAG: hypothetical protein WCE64_10355 [Bacteroidales bacterium]
MKKTVLKRVTSFFAKIKIRELIGMCVAWVFAINPTPKDSKSDLLENVIRNPTIKAGWKENEPHGENTYWMDITTPGGFTAAVTGTHEVKVFGGKGKETSGGLF